MTLLDLPNSVAQSVLDAMLPGLEAEHGSPSSKTRDDTGGFTLEWHRGRETLCVSIAADGATSRQYITRDRKPGTLSALPTAPEGTCEQPSEEEMARFDRENVADPYDGGRL